MKKLLIASLIASTALSAVADETTLYGSIGYDVAVNQTSYKDKVYVPVRDSRGRIMQDINGKDIYEWRGKYKARDRKGVWDLETDELNFGIKGEENINPNLNAFWKLQFNADSNGKLYKAYAYVGLKGDSWGTLTLGTQDSLVKVVTDYNDIFDAVGFWGSGAKYAEQLDHPDRVISYVSPNWSGFQFGVAGILNGKDGRIVDTGLDNSGGAVAYSAGTYEDSKGRLRRVGSKSFGAAQVGAWYDNYGFYGGLAYQYAGSRIKDKKTGIEVTPDDDGIFRKVSYTDDLTGKEVVQAISSLKARPQEITAAAIGYKNDQFKIGITEKHLSSDGDKVSLAGEYYYGPHTVRAGFAVANSDDLNYKLGKYCYDDQVRCGSKEVYTYALGYKYNLSKRTYTYVEGLYADVNSKKYTFTDVDGRRKTIGNPARNAYEFKFGLRHDF